MKRSVVNLSEEVSELEYQRVKKQSVLNSITMKMNIERPVDNIQKLQKQLEKELEVKDRELQDTFDAKGRLNNIRDNRKHENVDHLQDDVQEIKSLI